MTRRSAVLFLMGMALVAWLGAALTRSLGEHYWSFGNRARATQGLTESEARAAMGNPNFVIRREEVEGRPLDFPWADMHYRPVPRRPVTNRVLLYRSAWSAAYLFIGRTGRVEHVALAGT